MLRYVTIIFLIFQQAILGQNSSIKVIDASSEEGIAYANIVLFKVDGQFVEGFTTNSNGLANFEINQRVTYKVSFLGYESLEGQISRGEHLSLEMQEQNNVLDNVVITGQYAPRKADQSIYKIEVIDNLQLQQRGVNNLADALSQETFIRLTTDPSLGTSLEMQGMGGENVKYLIDGVPIIGRVGGDIDLSQINMDNIDHIEIVQGPMSVVYGTDALAGVVNIITKKNTSKKNLVKITTYSDSKNNYNFGFYSSIIRGRSTITASGNRNMFQGIDIDLNVDDFYETGEDRYMEFKPKLVYNGDLEYAYNKNDFSLKTKSDFMRSELRNYINANPFTLRAKDNYFITLRLINTLNVSGKLTQSMQYNITGAFTYFKRDTEDILSDLSALTHTKTGTTSTIFYNGMTRGSFTLSPEESVLNYQFGWDINYDKGTGERIDDENASMSDYAAFLSAQWKPLDNLSVQPGFRYIYNTSFEAPLIPSVNFQWKIIDNLNFRASYAKGFRAPSLKELYLDFHDSNHNLTGNPDLLAETTNSYNSSLTYKIKKDKFSVKLEPSLFYNNGNNVITLIVTDPQNNAAETTNLGGRRTLGANFNVSLIHYKAFDLSTGYSLTGESYDFDGIENWTDEIFYSNYTINTKYNLRKHKLVLMANYKLYGKTPALAYNPDDDQYYNIFTEALSDLELTASKQFFKNKLNVVVGSKNIFDNYSSRRYGYVDGREFLSPINYGISFFTKANYTF